MSICPMTAAVCDDYDCVKQRCKLVLVPLIGALHFVGFTDTDRYDRAVRHFGEPDFVHRSWDHRAASEIGPNDVAVFASTIVYKCRRGGDCPYDGACWDCVDHVKNHPEQPPSPYSWDDSAQLDDPATQERRG
jgi:hypothetical protein